MALSAVGVNLLKKKVYDSPEELVLVRRAKVGDEDAFRSLYDAHHKRVFVAIKRMLPDEDVALWVSNSALTKVWKGLPGFKEQSKFSTWITRIAINEVQMYLRTESRRHREVSLDTLLSDGIPNPNSSNEPTQRSQRWLATRDLELEGVADRQVLERAISRVPEQYHRILRLRFWEGMSLDEIQREIGPVSVPAVKSRVLRGRAMLMKQVEKVS